MVRPWSFTAWSTTSRRPPRRYARQSYPRSSPSTSKQVAHVRISIRPASPADAAAIAAIYNQGIEDRGATFETELRSPADIVSRLGESGRFPLLVAEDEQRVVGWAGLSSYRPRDCYTGIAEFSIYL